MELLKDNLKNWIIFVVLALLTLAIFMITSLYFPSAGVESKVFMKMMMSNDINEVFNYFSNMNNKGLINMIKNMIYLDFLYMAVYSIMFFIFYNLISAYKKLPELFRKPAPVLAIIGIIVGALDLIETLILFINTNTYENLSRILITSHMITMIIITIIYLPYLLWFYVNLIAVIISRIKSGFVKS